MHTDIVFSGLCSFLNVTDSNPTMPEPSVILVRTDGAAEIPHHMHGDGGHVHIPFVAFDSTKIGVEVSAGLASDEIPQVPTFRFFRLDGVKLSIANASRGKPTVRRNYNRVVRKDDYFPEAKNKWNRDFVPRRGRNPKSTAVAAFMRFGEGTISAHRISKVQYKFVREGSKKPFVGRFAEEVVYRFRHSGRSVVIELSDLVTRRKVGKLTFSPVAPSARKLTIFIGNNMPDAMDDAVRRTVRESSSAGNDHFVFLNLVASKRLVAKGPVAEPVEPREESEPKKAGPSDTPVEEPPVGGPGTGFCGPGNANGTPTS